MNSAAAPFQPGATPTPTPQTQTTPRPLPPAFVPAAQSHARPVGPLVEQIEGSHGQTHQHAHSQSQSASPQPAQSQSQRSHGAPMIRVRTKTPKQHKEAQQQQQQQAQAQHMGAYHPHARGGVGMGVDGNLFDASSSSAALPYSSPFLLSQPLHPVAAAATQQQMLQMQMMQMQQAAFSPPPPVPLFVAPSLQQQQMAAQLQSAYLPFSPSQSHYAHAQFPSSGVMQAHGQAATSPASASPASSRHKSGEARPRRPPQSNRAQSAQSAHATPSPIAVAPGPGNAVSGSPVAVTAPAGGGRHAHQGGRAQSARQAQQQHPQPQQQQTPPLAPPVAEYIAVGYLGSCDSGGFASASRSNAQLINALCGRVVFPLVAAGGPQPSEAPFAQEALRRARDRASKTSAPAAVTAAAAPNSRGRDRGAPAPAHAGAGAGASRAPIRLAEQNDDDEEEGDCEAGSVPPSNGPPALASSTKVEEHKEQPHPSGVSGNNSGSGRVSLVSEDVTVPVSTFAALQLHVDTHNKLLHMQMAPVRPATPTSSSSSSITPAALPLPGPLGLGLDGPLTGLESEGWAEDLARLPVSLFANMDGAQFHEWLVGGTSQRLRAALFLFCSCHYIVVLHPSAQLQMQWIYLLRVLHALKSRLLTCFVSASPSATVAAAGGGGVGSHSSPNGGASTPTATSADAAALYRALFSSVHLSSGESKALSKCSSPLPLCFTPCVSFVVQRPRFLATAGSAVDPKENEQALQQFGDSFASQLSSLCAEFDLVPPAQGDVSPAASALLLALKHAAPEKPDKPAHGHGGHGQGHHSHGHAHGHGHGHGQGHGGGGSHSSLFEPPQLLSADEQQHHRGGDSDDSQRLVAPLMYLHTQRPVIVTCFDELFDSALTSDAGGMIPSSNNALVALRGALERCIFVARAQVDSLSQALARDLPAASSSSSSSSSPSGTLPHGGGGGGGVFSLLRLLHSMQTVHSWVAKRVSPCAAALDATLLACLHIDYQYSALRCEKAAAVAKKLYVNAQQQQQSQLQQARSATSPPSGSGSAGGRSAATASSGAGSLPPGQFFYSALVHKQRLSTCVRLFHKLAGAGDGEDGAGHTAAASSPDPSRASAASTAAAGSSAPGPLARAIGPAVSKYEALLRADLERYWLNEHRGCDAVSVLHHACIYPQGHDVPRADGSPSSSYPLAHASIMSHSLRLSCHCGLSLLKLAKEPFDPSEIRAALTDRCCALQVESIGPVLYPAISGVRSAVNGSNGWNVLRYERAYNPAQGLSSLRGFYPNVGRTCFLPRVRFTTGSIVIDTFVGLVYECPLGHRWVCDDEEGKDAAGGGGGGGGAAPASRGYPRGRSDCFIFLPCVICRYLRHLQQKAASDAAAEQRQKRLLKEEKRGRLMLQAARQHASSGDSSVALSHHTVPSSTVRSHDRYAQLRRILIVTPPAHVAQMQIDPHVKSTRPALAAASASSADSASGPRPQHDSPTSASASISASPPLPLDNLTPTGSSEAQHALLPTAAFVAVQLPFVYWRREAGQLHCFTSPEAKHCVLLAHAISIV